MEKMLDARKTRNSNDTKVLTIIGQGTMIKGEIVSKGTVRIEGDVSGQVKSTDSIVVQESGRVKADLTAAQVIISGEVHGNIYAHERLEILSGGKVIGDITSPRIAMAEGVLFEGKCVMKAPTPPQEAKGSPAKS
jgi:cytoskeletal protein CcmA (bactofilin family)